MCLHSARLQVAVVSNGNPVAADMTDDRLAIRIPNAPGKQAAPCVVCILEDVLFAAMHGLRTRS